MGFGNLESLVTVYRDNGTDQLTQRNSDLSPHLGRSGFFDKSPDTCCFLNLDEMSKKHPIPTPII